MVMKMRERKWSWKRGVAALLCATTILTNTSIVEAAEYVDFADVQEEVVETVETTGMSEQEVTETETTEPETTVTEVIETESESDKTEMTESEATEEEEPESVEEESEIIEDTTLIEEETEEPETEELQETEMIEEVQQEEIDTPKASTATSSDPTMYDVFLADFWRKNSEFNEFLLCDGNHDGYGAFPQRNIVNGLLMDNFTFGVAYSQWKAVLFATSLGSEKISHQDVYDKIVYTIICDYFEDKLSFEKDTVEKGYQNCYKEITLYLSGYLDDEYGMTISEFIGELNASGEALENCAEIAELAAELTELDAFSDCGASMITGFIETAGTVEKFIEKTAIVLYLNQVSDELSDVLTRTSGFAWDENLKEAIQKMAACCGQSISVELYNSIYSDSTGMGKCAL